MAQYHRPERDITTALWQSPIATAVAKQAVNDAVLSQVTLTNGQSSTCEVILSRGIDVKSSRDHVIRFRAKKTDSGSAATIQAILMQGSVTIATDVARTLTTDFEDFVWELTKAQIDSITNYGNLRLRFTGAVA